MTNVTLRNLTKISLNEWYAGKQVCTYIKHQQMTEAEFEKQLTRIAPLYGCRYFKIPDTKMINKNNRKSNREQKRPFDGILVTESGNYCIECKVDSNTLKPHQKVNLDDINKINGRGFVLRVRNGKQRVYVIECNGKTLVEFGTIDELIKQFI